MHKSFALSTYTSELRGPDPVLCTVCAYVHVCMYAWLWIEWTNKQTNKWDVDSTCWHSFTHPKAVPTLSFPLKLFCFSLKVTDKTKLSQPSAPDPWRKNNTGNFFLLAAQRHFLWRKHPDNRILKNYSPRQSAFPSPWNGIVKLSWGTFTRIVTLLVYF